MIQRSERFTKAYDSLITAFFEGTLAKGTCLACACGNIIFSAVGEPVTPEDIRDLKVARETLKYYTMKEVRSHNLWGKKRTERAHPTIEGKKEYAPWTNLANDINSAGYTASEFALIENAFEDTSCIHFENYKEHTEQEVLEDQYKGLCAVVDVLLALEGEESGGDELKAKFREHPKLVVA